MSVVAGHDAIHADAAQLPPGQAAGYTTGSPDIQWTAADWQRHPGAVRICQDNGSDHTADVLDVEGGAATNSDVARWYRAALSAYRSAARPGQRAPAVYTSGSNVTALVNALLAGGVTSGPKLWIARWDNAVAADRDAVNKASGPFPIVGFQYASGPVFDSNVFSADWLAKVSAHGQYAHVTDGVQSLGEIAGSRGMRVESWVDEQERMHPDDGANLAGAAVPPAGMRWWSVHP